MRRIGIFLSSSGRARQPLARPRARSRSSPTAKGKFLNASLDKASADNERMAIRLKTADNDIAVVQIAGLIARRIVCNLIEGQEVAAGQRFGLIRFGSRADLYLPLAAAHYAVERAAHDRRRDRDRRSQRPRGRASGRGALTWR